MSNPENSMEMTGKMGFARFYKAYTTQFTMAGVLVAGCVLMSILSPYFLTAVNFSNLMTYITVTGTLAAGQTLVLLQGGLDLSQTASMAFGIIVMGTVITSTGNPVLAMLAGVGITTMCGTINAFIITKFRINALIATIGMAMVYRAFPFIITNGANIQVKDAVFKSMGYDKIAGIPILFFMLLVVYVFVYYFLKYTPAGRQVYATGGNAGAAYLAGIKINKIRVMTYIINGVIIGVSAIIWLAQMSVAMPNAGTGLDFDPLIGALMGGIGFRGGKGTVIGTLIGMAVLTIFANAMTLLSVGAYYQQLSKGLLLILAVGIDAVRGSKSMSGGGGMPGM